MSLLDGSLRLSATGPLAPEHAWARYTEPRRWSVWSPQIREVDYPLAVIEPGTHGRVRGVGGVVAVFTVDEVDHATRTWSYAPTATTPHVRAFRAPDHDPTATTPHVRAFRAPDHDPTATTPHVRAFRAPDHDPTATTPHVRAFRAPDRKPTATTPHVRAFRAPDHDPTATTPHVRAGRAPVRNGTDGRGLRDPGRLGLRWSRC
ncbi:hypothetical protein [Phycicoccus jejuensis]|uniref:hypothetical protein n=1 Tax=Phycicoccus jejuensis TaxID=367299 RepID=UPI00068BDFFC|nr:hypothetical protein [Phycicoccus jejuensis]